MYSERSSEKRALLVECDCDVEVLKPQVSKNFVMLLLVALNTLIIYDTGAVTGILSAVQFFYGLDDASGGLIQTFYAAAFIVILVFFFRCGDHLNKKCMILVSSMLWLSAVVLSSFVPEKMFFLFLVLRAATAVGNAATKTLVPVICAEYYEGKKRSYVLMAFFLASALGSAVPIVPGSIIMTNNIDWQWGLRIAPSLGVFVVILLYFFMEESEKAPEKQKSLTQTSFLHDLNVIVRCKTFLCLAAGCLFHDVASKAAQFWLPTLTLYAMQSTNYDVNIFFGLDYATIVTANLAINIAVGIFGIALSVHIAQRIRDGFLCLPRSERGHLIYVAVSHLIALPLCMGGVLLLNQNILLSNMCSISGMVFTLALVTVVTESILNTCEPQRHAAMNASFVILSSIAGDGISPLLLGWLSDSLRIDDLDMVQRFYSLRNAILYTAIPSIIASVLFLVSAFYYPADAERVSKSTKESNNNDQENESEYGALRRFTRSLTIGSDSYTFELAPGETRIGKASIEKTDKEVDYSIAEGGAEGTIQFDPKTGELTYTGEIEKDDYEQTLKLLATSGRHVAFANAKVVVKGIGSLVPKFAEKDPWTFIMKTMEPGLPVYEFNATDGDEDAVLQFSVESVTATDFLGNPVQDPGLRRIFSFPNGSSELVMVEDISALSVLGFRVSVAVNDLSHPNEIPDKTTLTVIAEAPKSTKVQPPVLRVNDILELIPISGALPINSYVYTVSARPSMSNSTRNVFAYALLQEDDHFEIHPDTGVIQTIASLRDLNGTTNLTISVSHLPSNTSTLVFAAIQVLPPRDSNPRFESRGYSSKIPEGFPVGKAIVTIAAVDDDGDSIRYELDGEHPEMFSVDEKGEIKLVSALDREELETIQLFVRAIDATNRSDTIPFTITVTDENDESPVFSQEKYTASIMENALEGSYVVSTPATDRDLSPIEYSIRVTNDVAMLAKVLAIDKKGEIRTSGDLSGMVGHFIFEVVVSDSIHSTVAEVSLTVVAPLHCHPRFSMDDPRVFVVRENEPEGTVLGKVVAAEMDERCQRRFALFENSTQQYVNRTADASIDPITGEIRSARAYDYEKEQSIPIIPSLLSHTLSTQMGAEIRVEDDNDNPLFFDQQQLSFTAAEDLSVGSVIGVVSVTELDESDQVFYNLLNDSDGRFAIDRLTGEIRLAKALDREENDEHVFEVMASNTEKRDEIFESGRLQVHVTVEDVDDNPPVFVAGRREFPLLETTLPGTVLTRVKAVDPDIIEGTGVFYSIESVLFEYRTLVSSVDTNLFSIDAKSGRIRLEKDVREYLGGVFDILVVSSDQEEGAGHHDKLHLRFYVHSSSDVVVFRLPENVATVSIKNITNGARLLSEASQYDVLVIGFEAHKIANKFVRNMTDVHTVFVNKTIGECLSSEKALILLDRAKAAGADVPAAGRLQSTDLPSSEDPITHLVVVLSLVFFAMLSFMMCIFGCCMCHYRLKYQAEKKRQEDLKILAASEKKRTPVQELLPPQLFLTDEKLIERHSSRASFEPIHDSHRYSAQEVSMSFDDKPPVEPEKDYL